MTKQICIICQICVTAFPFTLSFPSQKNKFLASFINMLLYLFSALVVKFVVCNDITTALCVVAINSFLGCLLAMWFDEKLDERREKKEKGIH